MSADYVVLGQISGVFGVKGWVKVFSYTEPREAIADYSDVLLKQDDVWQPAVITTGQRQGKTVVLKFAGIDDRDQAAALIQQDIAVERAELSDLSDGEYYWTDLAGCTVKNIAGVELGTVKELLETGANDVLVVKSTTGQQPNQQLIPWVQPDIVQQVDIANRQILVDWEGGYFADDAESDANPNDA